MSKKEELIKKLIVKTSQKSHGFKLFTWGVALGILNFLLDGLCNALLILSWRGDLGEKGKSILSFFEDNFLIAFVSYSNKFTNLRFVEMVKHSEWNWKN